MGGLTRLASMCALRASKSSASFGSGAAPMLGGAERGAMLRAITRKAGEVGSVVLRDAKRPRRHRAARPSGGESKQQQQQEQQQEQEHNSSYTTSDAETRQISTTVPTTTYENEMSRLLMSASFSDVKLSSHGMKKSGYAPIPCHRVVLCRYPFFRALLSGTWRESKSDVIALGIETMSRESLQTILEFTYTANRRLINDNNVMDILHCSSIFGMDDLKNISERYVSDRLDVDNALDCLEFASMLGLERLCREARDMIEFSTTSTPATDSLPRQAETETKAETKDDVTEEECKEPDCAPPPPPPKALEAPALSQRHVGASTLRRAIGSLGRE